MGQTDRASIDRRRRRLRRTAGAMRWVSFALAALGPIALVAVWTHFEALAPSVVPGLDFGTLSVTDRVGGYAISLLPASIAAWGFVALGRLFGRFAAGDLLDAANARRLRGVAIAVIALVPAKVIGASALSVWLTRDNLPGTRQLQIALSSDDLGLLVIGVLLLVLATVLHEAADIAEEHRQFV